MRVVIDKAAFEVSRRYGLGADHAIPAQSLAHDAAQVHRRVLRESLTALSLPAESHDLTSVYEVVNIDCQAWREQHEAEQG